jgi:hypothetical protein
MKLQLKILLILFLTSIFVIQAVNLFATPDGSNIIITEVLYDAPNSDTTEEWVELFNPLATSISLAGWTLEDNTGTFSLSGSIAAGGFYVIAKSSSAFQALYGFTPDLAGSTLALSNSGDQLTLKNSAGLPIDFVAWENYATGWTVSAVDTTIRRISATDTDTGSDWENSGTLGDPKAGNYGGGSGDSTPPTITITNPINGATLSGTVSITANASDNIGVTQVEFYIDNILQSTDTAAPYSYNWDSRSFTNGSHTLKTTAFDAAANSNTHQISVIVQNNDSGSSNGF